MIKYFIIFTALGFAIGRYIPSPKVGASYIALISLLWGSHSEIIWGIAALGELSLGYLVATIFVTPRMEKTIAAQQPLDLDARK